MTKQTSRDAGIAGRRKMRGLLCCLIALATFLLTIAVLLPTYLVPSMKKIPLDIAVNTLSVAPNSSLVDMKKTAAGEAMTENGVPLQFRVYVTVEEPANAEIATLQAAVSMSRSDRPAGDLPISASVDRVTLDRSTGMPVADPPATVQTVQDKPADAAVREGLQYKFPFGTERQSYPYFDTVARVTRPIDYLDDSRVEGGMQLYHFRQTLDPINLRLTQPDAKLTLAASAWGIPGGDEQVTFDLYYENTRDVWVEPASGAIVAVEEHLHRFLARSVDDPHALTTLDARTTFDPATLEHTTSVAKEARTKLRWGTIYAPILLAGFGVTALAAAATLAIWASRQDRRRQHTAAPAAATEVV
ncbi:MAG: DUF3068 domain-containing protein [Candidatus Nanopelagicales bacterium]